MRFPFEFHWTIRDDVNCSVQFMHHSLIKFFVILWRSCYCKCHMDAYLVYTFIPVIHSISTMNFHIPCETVDKNNLQPMALDSCCAISMASISNKYKYIVYGDIGGRHTWNFKTHYFASHSLFIKIWESATMFPLKTQLTLHTPHSK